MTGALLTESWDSVQKLVEGLRPSMLKVDRVVNVAVGYRLSLTLCVEMQICRANDSDLVGLRPELINRTSPFGLHCKALTRNLALRVDWNCRTASSRSTMPNGQGGFKRSHQSDTRFCKRC